jgi:excisionase family DNA binding protein
MSQAEMLARIFGPDTLELLDSFVRDRVGAALGERDAERRWLSVAATADYLSLSEKAVRRRIERGTISYTKHGSRILIDRLALDAELAGRLRHGLGDPKSL